MYDDCLGKNNEHKHIQKEEQHAYKRCRTELKRNRKSELDQLYSVEQEIKTRINTSACTLIL